MDSEQAAGLHVGASGADLLATALQKKNIPPGDGEFPKPLPEPDFPKSARLVECDAGNILRKDACLEGPYPIVFRLFHQRLKQ